MRLFMICEFCGISGIPNDNKTTGQRSLSHSTLSPLAHSHKQTNAKRHVNYRCIQIAWPLWCLDLTQQTRERQLLVSLRHTTRSNSIRTRNECEQKRPFEASEHAQCACMRMHERTRSLSIAVVVLPVALAHAFCLDVLTSCGPVVFAR